MKSEDIKSVVLPKQLISADKAKELNQNFISKRGDLHDKALGREDANAVWYSLEELENYIEYIKSTGAENGYIVDGIRFYFGVYSEDEEKDKAGYTTLFLSPTGKNAGQISKLTDPEEEGNSQDLVTIEPLNFGSMGNPPKKVYGF
jgi:hypothetical protein